MGIANALHSITPPPPRGGRSKNPRTIQYTTSDSNFSHNTNPFNNVLKIRSTLDDWSQLLACLMSLELMKQHGNIRQHCIGNIGEWFTRTEGFKSWQDWSGDNEGGSRVSLVMEIPGLEQGSE